MRTIDIGTSFTLRGQAPTATFLRVRPSDAEVTDSRLIIIDELGVQHLTFTEPDWPVEEDVKVSTGRSLGRMVQVRRV